MTKITTMVKIMTSKVGTSKRVTISVIISLRWSIIITIRILIITFGDRNTMIPTTAVIVTMTLQR